MAEIEAQYYPLSRLPVDAQGAVSAEALDVMLGTGQAEETALQGLGWIVRCKDSTHQHKAGEDITLIGNDRMVKIGAACSSQVVHPIPTQEPRAS